MLFRSNLDSGLKKKLYVYILFGFLQKGDVWGKKTCVHQDQPQLYNLLCFIQQSLRDPSEGRTQTPGEQILFHRYRQVVANQKVV